MSIRTIEGGREARDLNFVIVAARFNESIVEKLIRGACDTLRQQGATDDQIEIVRVPGAFELPVAIRQLLANPRHDAVIALGAVIRGDTPHFDYVAGECAAGLSRLAIESGVPIAFGVLTTDTYEQALERAGASKPTASDKKDEIGDGNKGSEAALCAIEMANLVVRLGG